MNILFSSDDNYAQHMGVAIYSVLKHNTDVASIRFFIIDNDISEVNKKKLNALIAKFDNAYIEYIPFAKWRDSLKLDMAWNISISAYGRLFVASMLPDSVDKVLYLDCDMIVCDSLKKLWSTDMGESTIAAVQDAVMDKYKMPVGLSPEDKYFNSGMLLIDLAKWRKDNIEKQCVEFIVQKQGRVIHHDQGVLNAIFRDRWYKLPIEDNLMTIHYIFSQAKIRKFFKDQSIFYTDEEVANAKCRPVILHFTPSFTSRPWVRGCRHPLRKLYWTCLSETPWAGAKAQKDNSKWYVKLINWRYRNLPF